MNKTFLKGLLTSFLAVLLIMSCMPILASAEKSARDGSTTAVEESIDIMHESSDVIISEVLTFDELLEKIARDKGISESQAKKEFLTKYGKSQRSKQGNARLAESDILVMAQSATYRTISKAVNEWWYYQPTILWYCETSEWGSYWGIVKVVDTTLNRAYLGVSKQFSGTLYTNLESASKIHYYLNGDFYDNGTTTYTGGGEIGISGTASLNFSVSYATNHFGYMYYSGDIITQ